MSDNKVLIGTIDQSTTSTKFTVFDSKGHQIEKTLLEHKQITPQQGWLEHDPIEIWENCQRAIFESLIKLKSKGYNKLDIKCVGITNQRETIVAWNKETGKPYHNAIVWNDQRTIDICKNWTQKHNGNKNIYSQITGLPINTYFSAFKIKWLQQNSENLKNETNKENILYGTMDSWIVWNLTNKLHITDVSNASRTFLMNLNTLQYEDQLLNEFDILKQQLPQIRSSSDVYGDIMFEPLNGIPITAILGDQQASSIGHGLFNQGNSKNTYGSGCFLLVNQGNIPQFQSNAGLLTTVLYQFGKNKPVYAFEGAMESGALTINWAKDKLKLFNDFDELNQQVNSVKDNGGVYFVPTLSGAYSPYWKDDASGTIVGMSFYTEKGHLLRALLESIAFRTKDVIDVIEKNALQIDSLKVDGGVTVNKFLMQFQSDILQKPIVKTKIIDSTSLGAAFAAGLAVGIYKDIEQIQQLIDIDFSYQNNQQYAQQAQTVYQQWQKAIDKAFHE